MAKFRTKPVVIEAMQVPLACKTPEDFMEWGRLGEWLGPGGPWRLSSGAGSAIEIANALGGIMVAHPGDWIVKRESGIFFPYKPEHFKQQFDPVE